MLLRGQHEQPGPQNQLAASTEKFPDLKHSYNHQSSLNRTSGALLTSPRNTLGAEKAHHANRQYSIINDIQPAEAAQHLRAM